MPVPAIEVDGVSKAYRIYPTPRHQAIELFTFGARRYHTEFWALHDVSFRVDRGATLGLVGNNGSGKSTLLQVIAGITPPTRGRVTIEGRVASLLELGAGFNPEFTGRENVELQGVVMGVSPEETRRRLPAIEAFAGIGDFIDRPVKQYSSGMFVRLAFAAAIHVDPDILLVDEALAVGDAAFQHQCIRRIRELQAGGATIVFVSHDMSMVRAVCTEAMLLDGGRVEAHADPATIANLYHARTASLEASAAPATEGGAAGERPPLFRHGSGEARIRQVELLDGEGRTIDQVPFGAEVVLRVHVSFERDVPVSVVGFSLRDRTGTDIVGTNTHEEGVAIPPRRAGDALVVEFRQRLPLARGTYSVSTAVARHPAAPDYLDWVDNALVLTVLPPDSGKAIHGKVWLPVDVSVHAS